MILQKARIFHYLIVDWCIKLQHQFVEYAIKFWETNKLDVSKHKYWKFEESAVIGKLSAITKKKKGDYMMELYFLYDVAKCKCQIKSSLAVTTEMESFARTRPSFQIKFCSLEFLFIQTFKNAFGGKTFCDSRDL